METKKEIILKRMQYLLINFRRGTFYVGIDGRPTTQYSWISTEAEKEYRQLVFDLAETGANHDKAKKIG
jgi:hypothetical protein